MVDENTQNNNQPTIDTTRLEKAIEEKAKKSKRNKIITLSLSIIIIVSILGFFYYKTISTQQTTTYTTTIEQTLSNVSGISSCTNITKPGTYYITKDIFTNINSGACINIKSNNVTLIGNNNKIFGNGPFVDVPPFTYGIYINDVNNVKVNGVMISKFSYGIYANSSNSDYLNNVNITNVTISGIYFKNSNYNLLNNSIIQKVASNKGALNITGNNNIIKGVIIRANAYYGIVVSGKNNEIYNSSLYNEPTDLMCSNNAVFTYSNKIYNSQCNVTNYCNWATCRSVNIPFNVSRVNLNQYIDTCGSINRPGTYYIESNLNYKNFGRPTTLGACISINAPNVKLYCNNHYINDSEYGIYSNNQYNVTINGCNFYDNYYSIYETNQIANKIVNTSISYSTYGIYLNNDTASWLNSIRVTNSSYSIFLSSINGVNINNVNNSNNEYGLYFNSGSGLSISNSKLNKNLEGDLYCSASTYNESSIFSSTSCNTSDCNWASCSKKLPPPLFAYPITNCSNLSYSGSYYLTKDLISNTKACININNDFVQLSCNGHEIIDNAPHAVGISINGFNSIGISNCYINAPYGIVMNNTMNDSMFNITISGNKPLTINNAKSDSFLALGLNESNASTISNSSKILILGLVENGHDKADSGLYLLNDSHIGIDIFNIENNNNGLYLNNTTSSIIVNGTFYHNNQFDTYCIGKSASMQSSNIGIANGSTKFNCNWFVLLNPLQKTPNCEPISFASYISLSNDYIYPYGSTCYQIRGNGTTINCNGHTILATSGGTFATADNANKFTVENCNFIGFGKTLLISNSSNVNIVNNTFFNISNSSIYLYNSSYTILKNNNIIKSLDGILLSYVNYSDIINNSISNYSLGLLLLKGVFDKIENNQITNGNYSIEIINSTFNTFKNNTLLGNKYSLYCQGSAQNKSGNIDLGNNKCISGYNCNWIVNSTSCI